MWSSLSEMYAYIRQNFLQEMLLDRDQSYVLLARIIFSCILLSAFSFLSTCIRDPVSIWDRSNITLIMTGVQVVIGNCLLVSLALLLKYGASKLMGSRPWLFWVTWRHRSRDHSTRGDLLPIGGPLWPRVYLAPLWRYGRLKFFQEGSSKNRSRSLVGRRSVGRQYLIYSFSLR